MLSVAGLKFMCLQQVSFQVAQTKVACTRFESIAESERTERRVATSTSTTDPEPISVYQATFHQLLRTIHAVININDPPLTIESLAICSTIAAAAPVVHIKDSDPPAGPILDSQVERAG